MNPIKIIICGSKGRVGQALVACAKSDPELQLVGEIDQGDDLAKVIARGDVVVDFSIREATPVVAKIAAEHKKALVIGTTGHSEHEKNVVRELARPIPVVWSANFSTGVNALFWMTQKVAEIVALAAAFTQGEAAAADALGAARAALASRKAHAGTNRADVRDALAAVTPGDLERSAYADRVAAQEARFHLPELTTTTIGSFPQTAEIRKARAAWAKGALSDADYETAMKAEIASVVKLQEDLGLDVLVHGEAERNDMVQYFAELLDGFDVTVNGWVQSYGSRCTRPSILWGDVARPEPMTVRWAQYAQSLSDKPVKGMLTGPVTILWSI